MTAQDLWNTVFKYAYPISFLGSIFYGMLAIFQVQVTSVFTNPNWLVVFNTFIGICGILSFAAWFNTDLSSVTTVTQLIGLDANNTRQNIARSV
jgi:hypothetical protein